MSTPSGNIVLDCRFNNVNNSGCHPNHICIPEHPEDPHHRAKHGAHVLQCLCRRSTTVQIGLTGPSLHQNSRNHVRNLASQPASRQSHSMHHNLTKACCRHICVTNAAMRPEAVNPWNASRPAQLSTDLSQVVDRRKHLPPPSSSQGSSDPGPIEHHQTLVILGFWPARERQESQIPPCRTRDCSCAFRAAFTGSATVVSHNSNADWRCWTTFALALWILWSPIFC